MKLSFVIPAHNAAPYLHPAVDSCLIQTYKDIEVVIVDDCSTDSTPDYLAWLEAQKDPRVKIIRNEKNLGRSVSRNWGNNAATGQVICVLDADDINAPRRAELVVPKFKAGAMFVHGAAHRMDPVGRDLGMMPTDVFNKEKALETLTNGIVHSSVAYTKEFAMKYTYQAGDVARLGLDDWACFLGAALDGVRFEYVPVPLCAYRDGVGITAVRSESEVTAFKKSYAEAFTAKA
jgi:glycosyltransferase involved in cell wall biosynthesis